MGVPQGPGSQEMNEREIIEHRQNDRRKGDRRKAQAFICDQCGGALVYLITEDLENEYFWCECCQQKYIVLRFENKRPQIARVNNV